MKLTIALLAAGIALGAQPPLKAVSTGSTSEKALLNFSAITDLEKQLDQKISMAGGSDPMLLLGEARALYLAGYGAVVTQEVSLVMSPTISPFKSQITPQEVAQTHQRKVARLPLLKQTMRDMWSSAASSLTMVPPNEQIVLAVRLLYKSWEDTKGLPGQIILKGTRAAGLSGIQTEEQ